MLMKPVRSATIMQPDPWGGSTPDHKPQDNAFSMEGTVTADPSSIAGSQGQFIVVQPPSNAAKVIGILVIISGALTILSSLGSMLAADWLSTLLGDVSSQTGEDLGYTASEFKKYMQISGAVSILIGAGTLLSGVWMSQFQRRGVHLALLMILVGFIVELAFGFMWPDIVYASGKGLAIGTNVVCNAICGGIIAIPFMISNSGLDDSKLF